MERQQGEAAGRGLMGCWCCLMLVLLERAACARWGVLVLLVQTALPVLEGSASAGGRWGCWRAVVLLQGGGSSSCWEVLRLQERVLLEGAASAAASAAGRRRITLHPLPLAPPCSGKGAEERGMALMETKLWCYLGLNCRPYGCSPRAVAS